MWVFYILLFLPMLIRFVKTQGREVDSSKANKTAIGIFFLLLTILVMLRHESVGNDTRNYLNFFARHAKISWDSIGNDSLETGYVFLSKVISLISTDPRIFLIITSVIVTLMIYPTYKRLVTDSSLTMTLFCMMSTFTMMFSGIRQMLAIAIGFVAYEFTRKKKFVPFSLMVAFAMTIHTSAFMLAFMYPAYNVKVNKIRLLGLIPLLGLVFLLNEPIFNFISIYIEKYTRFEAEISSTGAYSMLLLFGVFLVFAFAIPDESKMDAETSGLRNFLIVSFALQMFAPIHSLAMRMNYYYIIFIPLLIPRIIKYRKKDMQQVALLARMVMVVFFVGYFFYNAYTSDNNLHVFPYHFFWENVI